MEEQYSLQHCGCYRYMYIVSQGTVVPCYGSSYSALHKEMSVFTFSFMTFSITKHVETNLYTK